MHISFRVARRGREAGREEKKEGRRVARGQRDWVCVNLLTI